MFPQERKPESVARPKKKVPKEFLDALKNTQRLPPPPFGRVPGEGVFPERPVDRRLTQDYVRQDGRAPEVRVTAPPPKFVDDILEDDIEKIAYDSLAKREAKKAQKVHPVDPVPVITKEQVTQQPKEQPPQPRPEAAPHISERPTTQHTVQSVYYPDNQRDIPEGKPSQIEQFRQNRSYQDLPKANKNISKEQLRAKEYERYYQTEQRGRRPVEYPEDMYYRPEDSQSPEYADPYYYPRQGAEIPITREELYRYYAEKRRMNTVPDIKEENYAPRNEPLQPEIHRQYNEEDLVYPPKSQQRIIYNQSRKAPRGELRNITNGYQDPLIHPSLSGYPKGYLGGYGDYDRGYDRRLKGGYPTDRGYGDTRSYFDPYASLKRSSRDFYGGGIGLRDLYSRARLY